MNGIIVLNKPAGRTSFEAVRAVSRLFSKEKAGHSGTLDPMATGVLPVFLGRATKLIQFLPDTDKEYIADIAFGIQTDTGDKEGKVINSSMACPDEADWNASLAATVGQVYQTPPMYSAIKQNGVPLYEIARQGKTVNRQKRLINIKEIESVSFSGKAARIRVKCSAGTYVRTLAEDLAARCGSLAHLTSLERTYACGFSIEDAVTIEELENRGDREDLLISPETLFTRYPRVDLDQNLSRLFLNGFVFPISRINGAFGTGSKIRVYSNSRFIGLGEITDAAELRKLWQTE